MGVSDVEQSLKLYSDILGYDEIVYDISDNFEDFAALPGGEMKYRRVLLRESKPREGAFVKLFGPTEIELIQCLDGRRKPKRSSKIVIGVILALSICVSMCRAWMHSNKNAKTRAFHLQ